MHHGVVEEGFQVDAGDGRNADRDDTRFYRGQKGARFARCQDERRAWGRFFQQLEEGVGRAVGAFLHDQPFSIADDEKCALGHCRSIGGGEHQRTHRRDMEPFGPGGRGPKSVGLHSFSPCLCQIGVNVTGGRITILTFRSWEVPVKVGVDDAQRVAALLALAAGLGELFVHGTFADQQLSEPERQPLLAHPARALKKQAGRQSAVLGGVGQSGAEFVVSKEWAKRHGGNMPGAADPVKAGRDAAPRGRRGALYVGSMTQSAHSASRGAFRTTAHVVTFGIAALVPLAIAAQNAPVRARALGLTPGIFAPGANNAITDVSGVRVGHATVSEGDSLRTGVTAIIPHGGDLFRDRVPAALHVGNGFGKLLGVTQLRELGEIETPIILTCTLCIWQAGDALAQWMLAKPENVGVKSINPLVGETNDGQLNATRSRVGIGAAVGRALLTADTGVVAEGSVGAGHGTVMFGWKGGIGTASRKLPASLGGYTIGVLVQGNYGGVLQIAGVPIGQLLGRYSFQREVGELRAPGRSDGGGDAGAERGDGSCMIVIATDAPLLSRNLERAAARAVMGLARTGSAASNGSGDYVLAFSTSRLVRRNPDLALASAQELGNEAMSAVFQAVVEATEEALYNALLMATPVSSRSGGVNPLPIDSVRMLLRSRGVGTLPPPDNGRVRR